MGSAAVATVVTAIIGGVFLLLQKFVEKRYNRAKDEVEKNSADVENMTKVVQGFKDLTESYRTTIKEQADRIKELEDELVKSKGG